MTIEASRAKQLAWAERQVERLAVVLGETNQRSSDWSYHPPLSDDWREWCTVARFAAADLRYREACDFLGDLRRGLGPFYCPACGEHEKGFRARLCLSCWWTETGYDQALKAARQLGRQWSRNKAKMEAKAS